MLRIAEIFRSIQGEGELAGAEAVFVRTTGCNLRCWFCDTPYTSWHPEGYFQLERDVLERVRKFELEHVVITGGEPLLQPDVVSLSWKLHAAGHFVTIETAGTIDRPVHADLMSISPKLVNSTPKTGRWRRRHDQHRDRPDVIQQLMQRYRWQLKFVIDSPADLEDVDRYLTRFSSINRERIYLMPQSRCAEEVRDKSTWLDTEAESRGCRLSPRLHIERFGNVRGR